MPLYPFYLSSILDGKAISILLDSRPQGDDNLGHLSLPLLPPPRRLYGGALTSLRLLRLGFMAQSQQELRFPRHQTICCFLPSGSSMIRS